MKLPRTGARCLIEQIVKMEIVVLGQMLGEVEGFVSECFGTVRGQRKGPRRGRFVDLGARSERQVLARAVRYSSERQRATRDGVPFGLETRTVERGDDFE